jgi:hypothetical protein
MKIDEERLKEFERIYNEKIEKSKPNCCPNCGESGLDAVVLYDVKPDEITVVYDCYCEKCGWSGEISPDSVANIEFQAISDDICCVCGHPLSMHIDEGNGWRCHAISYGCQCECFLRKDRANSVISYYSLKKMIEQFKRELEKEVKVLLEEDSNNL